MWCDTMVYTVDIMQTLTRDIQYNDMVLSVMIHRLILSYGLFIVSGCDLVCGVPCTWCGLCQVMLSDRTNCYIRSEDTTHWENPSEWKGGCGAIWWFDVWYSAVYRILFWLWGLLLSNAECYTRLKQIPKMGTWSVSAVWVCWVVVVWVRLIYYVKIWDLYCDPLWHDNVIWFLSAVECMIVWFGWSGLILYSLLYMGRLWECLFLWLSVWKLCRTLFSDICCWSCMVLWLCGLSGLCALLLIYPSVLVWYRWGWGYF